MSYHNLQDPLQIKSLKLANRIVMAPMSRYQAIEGVPGDNMAAYYQRRAQAEVGLIITESVFIDSTAIYDVPNSPVFFGTKSLEGWKKVVNAVHEARGKLFIQLLHAGSMNQNGFGPSPVPHPFIKNARQPKEMTESDIETVINSFVTAAKTAQQLGFDGVEIHGAHGYLIDQFFWDVTNQRTDGYGGQLLASRIRFAHEVVTAIRRTVGINYPISFRFSQWKLGAYNALIIDSPQILAQFLASLSDSGVDIFHVSTRHFDQAAFPGSADSLASWTKRLSGKVTIAVGSVGYDNDFVSNILENSPATMVKHKLELVNEQIARGDYDLIAIGRPLLADPQWWQKISQQNFADINNFTTQALAQLI